MRAQLNSVFCPSVPHLSQVIERCSATLVCASDNPPAANPFDRIWCLYEFDLTIQHRPDRLVFLTEHVDQQHLLNLISGIDASLAKAFNPDDLMHVRAQITSRVWPPNSGQCQTLDTFSARLRARLLLDPLDYQGDINMLNVRSDTTSNPGQWDFSKVLDWMDDPDGSRALCVVASAGTGKSTISAAMCSLEQTGSRIDAYHFVKYSDQRRLDPMRILKSIAHQLPSRLPEMLHIYGDMAGNIDGDGMTFEALLSQPLHRQVGTSGQPLFILFDALDEADPTTPASVTIHGTTFQPVVPCGNKVLQLIKEHLCRLPPSVRFIFTTRPDALSNQLLLVLRSSFPGMPELKPFQLRATQSSASDSVATSQDNQVMVFNAVLGCVTDLPLKQQLVANNTITSSSSSSSSSSSNAIKGTYAAYQAVFELAARGRTHEEAQLVGRLLQVMLAAQEPVSMLVLHQLGLMPALGMLPGIGTLFY